MVSEPDRGEAAPPDLILEGAIAVIDAGDAEHVELSDM